MTVESLVSRRRPFVLCAAALGLTLPGAMRAQEEDLPVTDDAAFHRCEIKFGRTWTDEAGNTYTLVGWRTSATGGATCDYRKD